MLDFGLNPLALLAAVLLSAWLLGLGAEMLDSSQQKSAQPLRGAWWVAVLSTGAVLW